MTHEEIIEALHKYYMEYAKDKPLDYTYGFFDALGVIRDLTENPTTSASTM